MRKQISHRGSEDSEVFFDFSKLSTKLKESRSVPSAPQREIENVV